MFCRNIKSRYGLDVIVSLTTTSSRVSYLLPVLKSLIGQRWKPGTIVLWLARGEWGKDTGVSDIPEDLLLLQKRGFIELRWTQNVGPHTKLVPSIKAFPDSIIVTADDDVMYPRYWLKNLVRAHFKYPDSICYYRGTKIQLEDNAPQEYIKWPDDLDSKEPRFDLFPTGKDGVLYPPKSLHSDAVNASIFSEVCRTNDDIWFKGMSLLAGTKCFRVERPSSYFKSTDQASEGLYANVNNNVNDVMVEKMFKRYPDALRRLITCC